MRFEYHVPRIGFMDMFWPGRALVEMKLTVLYNAMDEGAYADLKALHRALDEAVADCYGWPKAIAQDDVEIVARLTELNRQISTGEREYEPFAYLPGPTTAFS